MKTKVFSLAIISLFLFFTSVSFAQNNGLSVSITKINNSIYSVNDAGKHIITFEISGIESQRHADNLSKSMSGYRGVEEFKLTPIEGTNNWKATGVLYKYAKDDYFKYFFKFMKVSEVIIDNNKVLIENL